MSYTSFDESRIKELFKQFMLELLQEQREVFYDLFTEVIEDFALANAINGGQSTGGKYFKT